MSSQEWIGIGLPRIITLHNLLHVSKWIVLFFTLPAAPGAPPRPYLLFPPLPPLQLMVHRRLLFDDNFGVMEALDEPGLSWDGIGLVVRGTHRIALTPAAAAPAAQKGMMKDAMYTPRRAFAALDLAPAGVFFVE